MAVFPGRLRVGTTQYLHTLPAKQASFKRIAFQLEDERQLPVAQEALSKAGVKFARIPPPECGRLRIGAGLRFADPIGATVELFAGMVSRPQPFLPHPINLSHLSHAVMKVAEFDAPHRFYTGVMNFRTSDFRHEPTGEPYFTFLRCFPNPYHHSFAIQKGPKSEFFHIAFHVNTLDDLMYGRNRLIKAGITVAPTPGRHMASGSIFQYFTDPDGFTVEYTHGMEEFPEADPRPPRMLNKAYRTTDVWEGEPPRNLVSLGAMEAPAIAGHPVSAG